MEAQHRETIHRMQSASARLSAEKRQENKRRIAWTEEQDQYLQNLAKKYDERDWRYVAEKMAKAFPGACFNSKKCRARWSTCLRPTLKKDYLTEYETLLILAYHHELKNNWVAISSHFKKRHANFLRNNFHSILRKVLHSIRAHRLPNVGFFASYFVQALYIAGLLVRILGFSPAEAESGRLVPTYMVLYIRSYNITVEKCETYVSLLVTKFQSLYSTSVALQDLVREDFSSLATKVVFDVLEAVKVATKNVHVLTQQQILGLIEQGYIQSEMSSFPPLSIKDETKRVESEQNHQGSSVPTLEGTTAKVNKKIESIINHQKTASPISKIFPQFFPDFSEDFLPQLKLALIINSLQNNNITFLQALSVYDLCRLFQI